MSRSRQSSLWIDMDMLHGHSEGQPSRRGIVKRLMRIDVCRNAKAVVSRARSAYHRGFSPAIGTILSGTTFPYLTVLDLFLPIRIRVDEPFYAPLLETLALRSEAKDAERCIMHLSTLRHILSTSRRLKKLHLTRCVNTTIDDTANTPAPVPSRILDDMRVLSFDDTLLRVISEYFTTTVDSSVHAEVFSPNNIASTMALLRAHFDMEVGSAHSIYLRYTTDSASDADGLSLLFEDYFCALRICWPGRRDVVLRMDEDSPTWTWADLLGVQGLEAVPRLHLEPNQYDDDIPSHWLPTVFLERLHKLQYVFVGDGIYLDLLRRLPNNCPLGTVVFELFTGIDIEDLTAMWHWVGSRPTPPQPMAVVLKGFVIVEESVGNQRHIEAPVLDAMAMQCILNDQRVFLES